MLIRPIINEKSMKLIEGSFYTFEVSKNATKDQVKKLVAEKFKVTPLGIKMINLPKKVKLQRTRKGYFQAAGIKKAVVKLKKGEKIALFEVAPEQDEVEVKTADNMDKPKEKKSLLRGTKVKVEKMDEKDHPAPEKETGKPGKTAGNKNKGERQK